MKTSYLYTLNCPFTNTIKYVGISINPKQRFSTHISKARYNTNTRKNTWIKGLLNQGLKPILNVISRHNIDIINDVEVAYILECKNKGIFLYNLTSGEEKKKQVSQETKEKIRQANLGKKQSLSTVEKRRVLLIGQKRTKEVREKLSNNQKGLNNSMIKAGADFSKQINAMKLANTGKKRSRDTVNKIAKKLSIPIVQLSLTGEFIKEWNSISEVERNLGYKNGDISSVCKKAIRKGYIRKSAYGFKWQYKKEYEENNKTNNS